MINVPTGFTSLNRLSDCPAGRYIVIQSIYGLGLAHTYRAELLELLPAGTSTVVGADLMVFHPDGLCMFRDIALLADGAWRDSYGARARYLAELLPPELGRLVPQARAGTMVDLREHGELIWADEREGGNGA